MVPQISKSCAIIVKLHFDSATRSSQKAHPPPKPCREAAVPWLRHMPLRENENRSNCTVDTRLQPESIEHKTSNQHKTHSAQRIRLCNMLRMRRAGHSAWNTYDNLDLNEAFQSSAAFLVFLCVFICLLPCRLLACLLASLLACTLLACLSACMTD